MSDKFDPQALADALAALTEAVRTGKSVQEELQGNVRKQLLAGLSSEELVLRQLDDTANIKNNLECKTVINRLQEEVQNLRDTLEATNELDTISSTFTRFFQLTQERNEICEQLTQDTEEEENKATQHTDNTSSNSTSHCILL